jgi:hypothetical protein
VRLIDDKQNMVSGCFFFFGFCFVYVRLAAEKMR